MRLSAETLTCHLSPEQTDLCQPLHDAIRSFRDAHNRLLCEHVIRAPNRRSVPEYYDIITQPIDLIKIQVGGRGFKEVGVALYNCTVLFAAAKTEDR